GGQSVCPSRAIRHARNAPRRRDIRDRRLRRDRAPGSTRGRTARHRDARARRSVRQRFHRGGSAPRTERPFKRSCAVITNVVSVFVFLVCAGAGFLLMLAMGSPAWAVGGAVVGVVAAMSPRVAQQWERAIVLRLGKFVGLRGPGLFWI